MNEFFPALRAKSAIAINHVGYEVLAAKFAVIALGEGAPFQKCVLRNVSGESRDIILHLDAPCAVQGWQGQVYQRVDFSHVQKEGAFELRATRADGTELTSDAFDIRPCLFAPQLAPLICDYFQSQRCAGQYEAADKAVAFVGTSDKRTVDVSGGWYDASGDVSKYLSHLSYANYMNPQQTPLVVWALAQASQSDAIGPELQAKFAAEAAHGADFLVRMCDPSDAFYMTIFDKWTGDVNQREICAYATQQGHKSADWQAGFRQGGGMAIAALAQMGRLNIGNEYSAATYLATAKRAFAHLEHHNVSYLDDGRENIIDDYCALLAATELAKTANDVKYSLCAQKRAAQLMARVQNRHNYVGWFGADKVGQRPFFHASDEGLPILALVRYAAIASAAERQEIAQVLTGVIGHLLHVTEEVPNPFAYPRQLVKKSDGTIGTQFFFPHENESGYWWQGENARLASLACALRAAAPFLTDQMRGRTDQLSTRMMDWILGLNPYQSCMMQGAGRNAAQYIPAKFPNADGGICNGITSSINDENDIGFCETEDVYQSWRWGEQWLPHSAWFLMALCEGA